MKRYRITYWYNGDVLVGEIEASSFTEMLYKFYMYEGNDDIIRVEVI